MKLNKKLLWIHTCANISGVKFRANDNLIRFSSRLVGLKTEAPSAASTSTSTPQPVSNVVHYLASALLQIEQGIERRFLKAPLGKSQN